MPIVNGNDMSILIMVNVDDMPIYSFLYVSMIQAYLSLFTLMIYPYTRHAVYFDDVPIPVTVNANGMPILVTKCVEICSHSTLYNAFLSTGHFLTQIYF